MRPLILISILVGLLLCIGGCRHREFLYETPSRRTPVYVEFDWSEDPTANPSEMTIALFRLNSSGSSVINYDFKGKNGGTIQLSPGVYAAICHNNDSGRHGFIGSNSFDDFGIRLNDNRYNGNFQSNSTAYMKLANERIAHSPDSMWVSAISLIEIPQPPTDTKSPRSPYVLRFLMHPVVSHYTFLINNPINFNKSISVSATISGMASTVHPGRGTTGSETVTHLFEMFPTPTGNLIGEILTFGHCGENDISSRSSENEAPHILAIHATMRNGQQWSSVHDVTDQIHNSKISDCVIRLDSIPFPRPTGGEGFSPTVSGWTGTKEIIGM